MKFVHTFWSIPLIEQKFNDRATSIQQVFSEYACSAAWIKRNGYSIVLYTDKIGADLLGFIPYDEVIIIEPDNLNNSKHFAAKFKFEALQCVEPEDCLIDGDLIIRSKATCDMIAQDKHDALYSFYETNEYIIDKGRRIPYYSEMFAKMRNIPYSAPFYIPDFEQLQWPNTSLLRITNEKLKQEYVAQYQKHIQLLNNYDFGNTWPDIIVEQYFLKCLLDFGNYSHSPFIKDFPKPEANQKAILLKYTHLGGYKKIMQTQVEKWLKEANRTVYKDTLQAIEKRTKELCE